MGALLGREFDFSGASFIERFAKDGFEVKRDETIFRGGFFEAGVLTESLVLYVASVILFFFSRGPSFNPPSGRFRFPSVLDFLSWSQIML